MTSRPTPTYTPALTPVSRSAAFDYLTTPVDVSPGTALAGVDVDVSAYVLSGAADVIIQMVTTSAEHYEYGVRKNGSTDTWMIGKATARATSTFFLLRGVDANRIFKVFTQDFSVKTHLLGYTMPGITFYTYAIDRSLASTGIYQVVDISADTGSDAAIGAIFNVQEGSGNSRLYALRKNGSSDDFYTELRDSTANVHLAGVDAGEFAKMKIVGLNVDLYVSGYVTSGAVFFTNAVNKSTATLGTYVGVDITGDLQGTDDANGAILEVVTSISRDVAVRRNGATYDFYGETRHIGAITAIDDSDIFEQKIELASHDLYLTGYTLAP